MSIESVHWFWGRIVTKRDKMKQDVAAAGPLIIELRESALLIY